MKLLNRSKTFSNQRCISRPFCKTYKYEPAKTSKFHGTGIQVFQYELLCDQNAGEWVSMVSYLKN